MRCFVEKKLRRKNPRNRNGRMPKMASILTLRPELGTIRESSLSIVHGIRNHNAVPKRPNWIRGAKSPNIFSEERGNRRRIGASRKKNQTNTSPPVLECD